ncbi:MAG: hypothetical protein PW734_11005 [Verrucomicrobium sp.]|nr:hypothetical protein [Verrucomicrobium sp.]
MNKLLAGLDDGKRVSFVDIGPKLAEPDGTISPDMMPDYLHPTAKGYVIWAGALQPFVQKYTLSTP